MTDDLVKRLRKGVMCGDDPIVDAAADRIEQLEAALREIADCCTLPAGNDFEMREIASKALEGKNE